MENIYYKEPQYNGDVYLKPADDYEITNDPVLYLDPVDVNIYSGTVYDSVTGSGIPSATIMIHKNGELVGSAAARVDGSFAIKVFADADTITVSSAGYKTNSFPASTYQKNFELEPYAKELDPVLLPPGVQPKDNTWLWLLLGAGAIVIYKMKK